MDELRDAVQEAVGRTYALERELGGGGMSRVFLAHDEGLDRPVVVKVLLPELASGVSAQRFAREVRAAATLQHPHIVPVLFAGHTASEIPFYVMPYVPAKRCASGSRAPPLHFAESSAVLGDVAKALGAAHAVGLVHRDVKPDNVLLCGGAAVVTDFGIAHAMHDARVASGDSRLTMLHTSLGTPAYLSPEQAAGDDIDARVRRVLVGSGGLRDDGRPPPVRRCEYGAEADCRTHLAATEAAGADVGGRAGVVLWTADALPGEGSWCAAGGRFGAGARAGRGAGRKVVAGAVCGGGAKVVRGVGCGAETRDHCICAGRSALLYSPLAAVRVIEHPRPRRIQWRDALHIPA